MCPVNVASKFSFAKWLCTTSLKYYQQLGFHAAWHTPVEETKLSTMSSWQTYTNKAEMHFMTGNHRKQILSMDRGGCSDGAATAPCPVGPENVLPLCLWCWGVFCMPLHQSTEKAYSQTQGEAATHSLSLDLPLPTDHPGWVFSTEIGAYLFLEHMYHQNKTRPHKLLHWIW